MKTYPNLIDGKLVITEKFENVVNPVTGKVCAKVSSATEEMANQALFAAEAAFREYSQYSINQRAKLINELRDLLLEDRNEIIELLIRETGKTTGVAEYDFDMLTDCLSFFIEEIKRKYEEIIPDYDNEFLHYLKHTPVGVVVAFLAWNFPLLNIGYKLGPILATGNTCVIKPASNTPLTTAYIGEIVSKVKFPPGTVNILTGPASRLSPVLCESKIPRLLTMIGSTGAGLKMVGSSTTSIKRYSLELGGNAPFIVFDDADIDNAVSELVTLKFTNAGQICVSANRIFVHESIYEKFISKTEELVKTYVTGSGNDEGNILSPVISKSALDWMLELIEDAESKGAKVICGGKKEDRSGFFLQPTFIRDADLDMKVFKEEIFGPIIAVMPFSDEDDIYEIANDTDAGLASYVFTENMRNSIKAQERLQYGNILINKVFYSIQLPHGGIKQSGYGKDISKLCLDDYLDVKRISIKGLR